MEWDWDTDTHTETVQQCLLGTAAHAPRFYHQLVFVLSGFHLNSLKCCPKMCLCVKWCHCNRVTTHRAESPSHTGTSRRDVARVTTRNVGIFLDRLEQGGKPNLDSCNQIIKRMRVDLLSSPTSAFMFAMTIILGIGLSLHPLNLFTRSKLLVSLTKSPLVQ